MKSIILVLTIIIAVSATDWLEPVELGNPEKVLGTSFSGDNMRIYCSKRNGSVYHGDIKYYEWNGSSWVDMGWIDGDVNTFDSEAEPFITYDGQSLYFQRSGDEYGIYVADWVEGSGFINSRKLGSQISNYGGHYPSVTQDGQKLYFASSHKIYESTWNGSDWEEAVLMPDEINGGGGDI